MTDERSDNYTFITRYSQQVAFLIVRFLRDSEVSYLELAWRMLSSCDCCIRHRNDRPTSCTDPTPVVSLFTADEPHVCECGCRHLMRVLTTCIQLLVGNGPRPDDPDEMMVYHDQTLITLPIDQKRLLVRYVAILRGRPLPPSPEPELCFMEICEVRCSCGGCACMPGTACVRCNDYWLEVRDVLSRCVGEGGDLLNRTADGLENIRVAFRGENDRFNCRVGAFQRAVRAIEEAHEPDAQIEVTLEYAQMITEPEE